MAMLKNNENEENIDIYSLKNIVLSTSITTKRSKRVILKKFFFYFENILSHVYCRQCVFLLFLHLHIYFVFIKKLYYLFFSNIVFLILRIQIYDGFDFESWDEQSRICNYFQIVLLNYNIGRTIPIKISFLWSYHVTVLFIK